MFKKNSLENLVFAVSLANLRLLQTWVVLLHQNTQTLELPELDPSFYSAALLGLVLMTAIFWWSAAWYRKTQSRLLRIVLLLGFAFLLIRPVNFLRLHLPALLENTIFEFMLALLSPQHIAGVFAVVVVLLFAAYFNKYVVSTGFVLVAMFVPLAVMNVAHAGWLMINHQDRSSLIPTDPITTVSADPTTSEISKQRILWIIFDELDYRLTFEALPADVSLPNFDQIRSEAFVATQAQEAGPHTWVSISALMSGRPVDSIYANHEANDFNVVFKNNTDSGKRESLRSHPSFISQAKALGHRVGIVASMYPYCSIFRESYAACHQRYYALRTRFGRATTWDKLLSLFYAQLPNHHVGENVAEVQRILELSQEVAADKNLDIVILHLSMPHSPYIYNRASTQYATLFSGETSYFDNLKLADLMLGEIRQSMENAGLWKNSAVLVTADHGWRKSESYDGIRDRRVPYILKMPNQLKPVEWTHDFNVLDTSSLLLKIAGGEIATVNDFITRLPRQN